MWLFYYYSSGVYVFESEIKHILHIAIDLVLKWKSLFVFVT